jgi:C-terminal processing protease CtpA/Prc
MKMERTLNHKKNESATAIDLIVLTNGRAGSPSAIFSSILRPAGLTPQEAI